MQDEFDTFKAHNETYAGMQTAISWNVIYTPYALHGAMVPPPAQALATVVWGCLCHQTMNTPSCDPTVLLDALIFTLSSIYSYRYEGIFTPVFRGSQ